MSWNFGLDFGSVLGAGIGAFASNASSRTAFKYQKRLMERQAELNYEYGQKTAENSPSWNRLGLENAGYNPMLAVQNATSGANSSFASAQSSTAPDYASAFSSALDIQRVQNETKQTDSIVGLQNEQALTEESKRKNLEFQNAMLDVEKHLKEKDLSTYDQRFYTEMYHMMQSAEKLRQEASVVGYNADSARIVANANMLASQSQSRQVNLNAKWTPATIGAGIGAGVIGGLATMYGPAKFKALKALGKIRPVGFR